jgi:hypothetical protein
MKLNEHLIKTVIIPENSWEKLEMTEQLFNAFSLGLLDFITNSKSRFSILYGDQDKRFAEIIEEKVIEYTKQELINLYRKTL